VCRYTRKNCEHVDVQCQVCARECALCILLARVRTLSGTDLLVREGAVYLCVEKNHLVCPTLKHRCKVSPILQELRCCCVWMRQRFKGFRRCVWVRQRFEGFLDRYEKIFFLNTMPGIVLPRESNFFNTVPSCYHFLENVAVTSSISGSKNTIQAGYLKPHLIKI
jgi:hypothetical protein